MQKLITEIFSEKQDTAIDNVEVAIPHVSNIEPIAKSIFDSFFQNALKNNCIELIAFSQSFNEKTTNSLNCKNTQDFLDFIANLEIFLKDFSEIAIEKLKTVFASAITSFFADIERFMEETPDVTFNTLIDYTLKQNNARGGSEKSVEKLTDITIKAIEFKKFTEIYFPHTFYKFAYDEILKFCSFTGNLFNEILGVTTNVKPNFQVSEIVENEKLKYSITHLQSLADSFSEKTNSFFESFISQLKSDIRFINYEKIVKLTDEKERTETELKVSIEKSVENWFSNSKLQINSIALALHLCKTNVATADLFQKHRNALEDISKLSVLQQLTDYNDKLADLIEAIDNQNISSEHFNIEIKSDINETMLAIEDLQKNTFLQLGALNHFSGTIEVCANKLIPKVEDVFVQKKAITVQKILGNIIEQELYADLRDMDYTFAVHLKDIHNQFVGINKLVSFTSNRIDNLIKNKEEVNSFITIQKQRIEELIKKTDIQLDELNGRIAKTLDSFSETVQLDAFTNYAQNIQIHQVSQTTKKAADTLNVRVKRIIYAVKKRFYKLWYGQSDALLYARNIQNSDKYKPALVNELLDLNAAISPKKSVFKKIPFYYRELFLSDHIIDNDFWVGRTNELEKADKTFQRYLAGFHGALLILGEQNSGRTFLSQKIAERFDKEANIITVTPPFGGSINPDVFKHTLQNSLKKEGTIDEIFTNIDDKTVLILDDIELWWEKSQNGFVVIDEILDLIENQSNKCFFILNINIHSYDIINKIKRIENHFLNIIEALPFNSENIKNIILFRHQLSGLQLVLNNKPEFDYNDADFAKLFLRYFNYSGGFVGETLNAWIVNIENADDHTIYAKSPINPNLRILDYISIDYLLIILQFILHKRLTIDRLKRVTMLDDKALQTQINFLKRSGIIETENDVMFINKDMYIHLKNKLIQMDLI